MHSLKSDGAAAPKASTPANDNAPGQGRVEGEERERDRPDCTDDGAAKQLATLIARAALAGIEVEAIGHEVWLLRQRGRHIGVVHNRLCLAAAVGGLGLLS